MNLDKPCIVFTGGGTGGHVFPGIAIISELKKIWDGRIVWIGSGKEVERNAVEAAGLEFFAVPAGKLRRSLSLKNIADAFRVIFGYFESKKLLKKLKPVLVFSKGGYVSVPPCYAAAKLKIPVITHESDLSPGLATRLNAKKASKILVSWEKTKEMLSPELKQKTIVTGNPIREEIKNGNKENGLKWLGFSKNLPLILVLGGSQGALQVNELIKEILPELKGKALVAHQTGKAHLPCREHDEEYYGIEFIQKELYDVIAASDIIIGRAGAGTIWESAASKKVMVLIPLGGKDSRGDQVENAKLLAEKGAAYCLAGSDATKENLLKYVMPLLEDNNKRQEMAKKASAIMNENAAKMIANIIFNSTSKETT